MWLPHSRNAKDAYLCFKLGVKTTMNQPRVATLSRHGTHKHATFAKRLGEIGGSRRAAGNPSLSAFLSAFLFGPWIAERPEPSRLRKTPYYCLSTVTPKEKTNFSHLNYRPVPALFLTCVTVCVSRCASQVTGFDHKAWYIWVSH
jgi:hypothetical protein